MKRTSLAALLLAATATLRADTTDGSCLEEWALVNFQPKSASYLAEVPSSAYHAHTTVITLSASWCSFCQNQAAQLEVMRRELSDAGYLVDIVAINAAGAESSQAELVTRASFDLLQDTTAAGVSRLMGGRKDDFFIYLPGGRLAPGGYLDGSGPLEVNLSTQEGYDNLRQAILAAHDAPPGEPCGDVPASGRQLPGDFGQDAHVNLADAVSLLGYLFQGTTDMLPCEALDIASEGNRALLDSNGDSRVDLTDSIHLLNYLFQSGPSPILGAECVPIRGCPDRCAG